MSEVYQCSACKKMVIGNNSYVPLVCGRNDGWSLLKGEMIPKKCGGKLKKLTSEEVKTYGYSK